MQGSDDVHTVTEEVTTLTEGNASSWKGRRSFPLHQAEPASPVPRRAITPPMVPQAMKDLGNESVIGTGGGAHACPKGPIAEARAFRQAIDTTVQGAPLKEAAVEHEELRFAPEDWLGPFTGLDM